MLDGSELELVRHIAETDYDGMKRTASKLGFKLSRENDFCWQKQTDLIIRDNYPPAVTPVISPLPHQHDL
jgi:hypothetical protein